MLVPFVYILMKQKIQHFTETEAMQWWAQDKIPESIGSPGEGRLPWEPGNFSSCPSYPTEKILGYQQHDG